MCLEFFIANYKSSKAGFILYNDVKYITLYCGDKNKTTSNN